MAALVVSLSSRKAIDVRLTGGKGSGLARLLRDGFPVPPGFVIATAAFCEPLDSAFRLIMDGPGAPSSGNVSANSKPFRKKPSGPDNSPIKASPFTTGLEAARRFCLSWDIPAATRRTILDAYRRLDGPVAVRSSMVGEDAPSGSFAGLLDTVLEVRGEDALLDAVRRVLASAFGDRLWAYLEKSHAGTASAASDPKPVPALDLSIRPPFDVPSLAVVVQSMVRAEVSGVAFSVDPVSCRPGVVVEAVPGLGEGLVQGRVRPDRYRLDPRGELDEVVPAQPGAPLLDEPVVRQLGSLVVSIADRADSPQDVEWSWDGSRFHLLQSRPISSIAGKPVYSRRMVSDMAPGVVKPLVWSTKYAPIVTNVFAPVFKRIGGPSDIDYTGMSARFYSRVYMNITMFGEQFRRIGLPANFFEVLAREDKAAGKRFRFRLRMVPAILRLVRFAWREGRIGRRVGPFLESQHRKLDEFRTMDWASQSPTTLAGQFRRLKALHADSQWYVVVVTANMLIRSRILGRMIVGRWPGTDPRDVIKGYGRRSSLVPFEEIRKLANIARRLDRGLVEKLAGTDEFEPAEALAATAAGQELLEEFKRFMGRYGFLSANGSDFSEVPWVENPRLIWRTIGRLALARESTSAEGVEAHREEVLGLVRTGFGPLRRRVFDRLHASTVRFMDWRERVSLLMTEDSYLMRRCFLALGTKLVERKILADAADVFFLYEDELERVVADPAEAAAAAEKVAIRKAELVEDASLDPPDTLCCGAEAPALERPTAEGLEFLSGIGASGGVRKGRARVVHDPALEAGHLGPADILVVPFTDVGWMPILSGVGGIVAEAGGQLSHTSIIAREYAMPAVVSVRNATRLIRDGQPITIDGTAGRIYLHPDIPS